MLHPRIPGCRGGLGMGHARQGLKGVSKELSSFLPHCICEARWGRYSFTSHCLKPQFFPF